MKKVVSLIVMLVFALTFSMAVFAAEDSQSGVISGYSVIGKVTISRRNGVASTVINAMSGPNFSTYVTATYKYYDSINDIVVPIPLSSSGITSALTGAAVPAGDINGHSLNISATHSATAYSQNWGANTYVSYS